MRVGFDVITTEAGVDFHLFPSQSSQEHRPPLVTFARDCSANTAAVLLGHLCYQDELLAKLPQPIASGDRSDAEIVLAVYRQQGLAGLERLEGEFSLVVWDGERQKLFALRDPLGCWQLFWRLNGTQVLISTSLQPLLKQLSTLSFDLDFMAQFIMWSSAGAELPTERTPFSDIQRILPGTRLTATLTGQVEQHRWWNWADQQIRQESLTLAEASEQYAVLLNNAIRQRVRRGHIAAHLSGGMDSSSVVCLSRNLLEAGAGQSPLHTLSAVYTRPSLAGERAYAEQVTQQGGAIDPHWIEADAIVDFLWFQEGIPYHDEPFAGLAHLGMEKMLVDAAAQLGADTILTGMGGDELLIGTRLKIADQLRQKRWLAAFAAANQLAQANNQNVWSILSQLGFGAAYPLLAVGGVDTWLRRGFSAYPNVGKFSIPPWISSEFAQAQQMQQIGISNAQQIYGTTTGTTAELAIDQWAIQTSVGDWSTWHLAAPQGMHNTHPFLDVRVLSFGLKLPSSVREISGMPKPVLQTAMQGILPDSIRLRPDKACFNDLYWRGLSKHLQPLEKMVQRSRLHELGVFDRSRLLQCMRQASVGIGNIEAVSRMNITLALIAWFDQVLETRQYPLEQPTVIHQVETKNRVTC